MMKRKTKLKKIRSHSPAESESSSSIVHQIRKGGHEKHIKEVPWTKMRDNAKYFGRNYITEYVI